MEKEKLQKALLEKAIEMKAIIRSAADLERAVSRLETDKCLSMKENEQHFLCLSRKSTSGDRTTDKSLKYNPSVYLRLACNVEKEILEYC